MGELSHHLFVMDAHPWVARHTYRQDDAWKTHVWHSLTNADVCIVVLSHSYLQSRYCRDELTRLADAQTPVLILAIEDVSARSQVVELGIEDWVDFQGWQSPDVFQRAVDELTTQLQRYCAPVSRTPASVYAHDLVIDANTYLLSQPSGQIATFHQTNGISYGDKFIRPLGYDPAFLHHGDYLATVDHANLPVKDLLHWWKIQRLTLFYARRGMGKTTLARHFVLYLAKQYLADSEQMLPIWLDLSAWQTTQSFADFVTAQVGHPIADMVATAEDKLAVFIDNWSDCEQAMADRWAAIQDYFSDAQVMIFTRERGNDYPAEGSLVCVDPPASSAVKRLAKVSLSAADAHHFMRSLQSLTFTLVPTLIRWDFIALVLRLYVSGNDVTQPTLPTQLLTQMFNVQWYALPATVRERFTGDVVQSALEHLALVMVDSGRNVVSQQDALQAMQDDLMIQVTIQSQLLEDYAHGVRFQSATMQSYFAARALERDGIYKYLQYASLTADGRIETRWDEPIQLLLDAASPIKQAQMMRTIADVDPFFALEMALRAESTSAALHEHLIRRVLTTIETPGDHAYQFLLTTLQDDAHIKEMRHHLCMICRRGEWTQRHMAAIVLEALCPTPDNTFIDRLATIDIGFPEAIYDLQTQLTDLPFQVLCATLQVSDLALRQRAIWLSGELKERAVVPVLIHELQSSDDGFISDIVTSLKQIHDPAIAPHLLHTLECHPDDALPLHWQPITRTIAATGRPIAGRWLENMYANGEIPTPAFIGTLRRYSRQQLARVLWFAASQDAASTGTSLDFSQEIPMKSLLAKLQSQLDTLRNQDAFEEIMAEVKRVLRIDHETSAEVKRDAIRRRLQANDSDEFSRDSFTGNALPERIRDLLQHDDWLVRQRAVQQLAEFNASSALPELIRATHDDDSQVRLMAVNLLATLGTRHETINALIACLDDEESLIIDAAADQLKAMNQIDLPPLLYDKLQSDQVETVAAVIDILGHTGDESAVPRLKPFLDDERTPWVSDKTLRDITVEALVNIGTVEALSTVRDANYVPKDDSSPIILPDLDHEPVQTSRQQYTPGKKINILLRALHRDDDTITQRAAYHLRRYAKHLRGTDDAAILDPLHHALDDAQWHVRWASVEALAWIQHPDSVAQIVPHLDDPHWIVRVAAVRALVELSATSETTAIANCLQDSVTAVREAAAEALGSLDNAVSIPQLVQDGLTDEDDFVRLSALQSLIRLSKADAHAYCIDALHDPYDHIRWYALRHLIRYSQPVDAEKVARLLGDTGGPRWESQTISDLAVAVLTTLDTEQSRSILDQWDTTLDVPNYQRNTKS